MAWKGSPKQIAWAKDIKSGTQAQYKRWKNANPKSRLEQRKHFSDEMTISKRISTAMPRGYKLFKREDFEYHSPTSADMKNIAQVRATTPSEAKKLKKYYGKVNRRYFAGLANRQASYRKMIQQTMAQVKEGRTTGNDKLIADAKNRKKVAREALKDLADKRYSQYIDDHFSQLMKNEDASGWINGTLKIDPDQAISGGRHGTSGSGHSGG